jgi:hypothetical protein
LIAALYVDPRGPYVTMPDVDAWTEERDARMYAGPHAVVAHPPCGPCGPWGKLRHMCTKQDASCALFAVESVRAWGGVLEHPVGSKLWAIAGLPMPDAPADAWGGYSIEVAQVEWGHVARKRTLLYLVGVPREALEAPPYPGQTPTHWVSGGRAKPGRHASQCAKAAGVKICSSQQARRTPPEFAAYLVRLANAAVRP